MRVRGSGTPFKVMREDVSEGTVSKRQKRIYRTKGKAVKRCLVRVSRECHDRYLH